MKTVSEVSRLSGVSVRTLHYYDTIGLLKPDHIAESGYRYYGAASLGRLQLILLFRELEFPLDEIGRILDSPGFDRGSALDAQIKLLEMRRERLERLISFAGSIKKIGVDNMDFSAFDSKKIKEYTKEAKRRWGNTTAFAESEAKTAGLSEREIKNTGIEFMGIFTEFGRLECDPSDAAARELVIKLRDFITAHYYNCTDEILAGLGGLYAEPGELADNIDRAGGAGTAEFVSEAIACYTKKR